MREIRQKEVSDFLLTNEFTICLVAMRFGKCKTVLDYLNQTSYSNILIIHPTIPIKKSWQDDVKKWGFDGSRLSFSTTASLSKIIENKYDLIVADELQLFSEKQLTYLRFLIKNQDVKRCIGLTGTLTKKSAQTIKELTGLEVGITYTTEQGIADGFITDYRITVVETSLDNKDRYIIPSREKPSYRVTEQQSYDYLTKKIEDIKKFGGNLGFYPIMRLNLFKKSIAKQELTKKLIEKYYSERLLVFCGTTSISDSLGIPVFHSKSTDITVKDDFCSGKIQHLAVCKMLNSGITITPINKAIINSFDSNSENLAQMVARMMNYEYDNPGKIAEILIVCTNNETEKKFLKSALEFFNPEKITYKKYEEL